jgi:hypothetical protein
MASKGSAFLIGGCVCLMLFALASLIAVIVGGHAHANVGGLLFLFLVGGAIGLIVSAIYNKGRKDAIRNSDSKEPEKLAEPAAYADYGTTSMTSKTRSRLIVLFILAFPFVVLFGFLISQVITTSPSNSPSLNPDRSTNALYSPR